MKRTVPLLQAGTQGEVVTAFSTGGFTVSETWHEPGMRLPRHAHERASLNVVLQGTIFEVLGCGPVDNRPGSLVIKPGGASHANEYGTRGALSILVEAGPYGLDRMGDAGRVLEDFRHLRGLHVARLARELQQELRVGDEACALVVEGLVLQLMGVARRMADATDRAGTPPPWLRRARERLEEAFTPGDTLETIAAEAEVDTATLERAFRRYYGSTPGKQFRRSRLEWAAVELVRSDATVGELAQRAGFYDQSHFTRHFRILFGLTPGGYRRAARQ